MTAATVTATVQLFPLRQGDNTHPAVREMFPETHENSDSLTFWMELAKSLNNEGRENENNEEHCRLVSGAYENRYLEQICCIDNKDTSTQATIWCDSTHKQVLVHTTVVRL